MPLRASVVSLFNAAQKLKQGTIKTYSGKMDMDNKGVNQDFKYRLEAAVDSDAITLVGNSSYSLVDIPEDTNNNNAGATDAIKKALVFHRNIVIEFRNELQKISCIMH